MEDIEFDRLMGEVGPLDDMILACLKTPDGAYAIRFEQVDVLVERDEDRDRIALSVEIGAPPPSRALEVYETLLSYNLLWRETGGVRMALTGRKGSVVQFVDLTGNEINARSIATVAANLASLTDIWRGFLQSTGSEAATPAPIAAGDFIRA
jgi:hypothetical protein